MFLKTAQDRIQIVSSLSLVLLKRETYAPTVLLCYFSFIYVLYSVSFVFIVLLILFLAISSALPLLLYELERSKNLTVNCAIAVHL